MESPPEVRPSRPVKSPPQPTHRVTRNRTQNVHYPTLCGVERTNPNSVVTTKAVIIVTLAGRRELRKHSPSNGSRPNAFLPRKPGLACLSSCRCSRWRRLTAASRTPVGTSYHRHRRPESASTPRASARGPASYVYPRIDNHLREKDHLTSAASAHHLLRSITRGDANRTGSTSHHDKERAHPPRQRTRGQQVAGFLALVEFNGSGKPIRAPPFHQATNLDIPGVLAVDDYRPRGALKLSVTIRISVFNRPTPRRTRPSTTSTVSQLSYCVMASIRTFYATQLTNPPSGPTPEGERFKVLFLVGYWLVCLWHPTS